MNATRNTPPPTPERRLRSAYISSTAPGYRGTRAAAVLAAVLLALLAPSLLPDSALDSVQDGGVALSEAPEVGGVTDASVGEAWASLPIPAKPSPNQETRCDPKRKEVPINGGCYKELAGKPPCAEGEYVHESRCWIAVGKRSRPANSVQE